MSAIIYIEGGAAGRNSKDITIRCQQAFHGLLDSMGFQGRKPRLKACGGRAAVFDDFCMEHRSGNDKYVAMWIDSEEPMKNIEKAWLHLQQVTTVPPWNAPVAAEDDQVLFMTTCMETWIAADRETLRIHFGQFLNENRLPSLPKIEDRDRTAVQEALVQATKGCKNSYAKGKRSFDVLEKLNPEALRGNLPSFARVERILGEKL